MTTADDARVEALVHELRLLTSAPPPFPPSAVDALIREVHHRAGPPRDDVDPSLLAATLPLLHRCGRPEDLLHSISATTSASAALLEPGLGSAARQRLLTSLGEPPSVYFWMGHCAYGLPDPEIVIPWSPATERSGPPGQAAPWDTAGLLTARTLGRNLSSDADADAVVRRHSLPIQGASAPAHRRYLAEVMRCSFAHPSDVWTGAEPVRWYPGWLMAPPRTAHGGAPAEAPHHTFEVRRHGAVPWMTGLLAVVVEASLLIRHATARRRLAGWIQEHAVWEHGTRL